MPKVSVIIPTMQKDTEILNMLVKELDEDVCVGEIIIIDNSLKGYDFGSEKVKTIVPKKNLYVNPSWNLGVELSENNYIAILNDDILIPKNLCYEVLQFIIGTENCGLVGIDTECIKPIEKEKFGSYPISDEISFKKIKYTLYHGYWGSAIFGEKSNFCKIPEKIKVWCGDDYYIKNILSKGKVCYTVNCGLIKHLGSLTSKSPQLEKIKYFDMYNYSKINPKMKKNKWFVDRKYKYLTLPQKMFSIYNTEKHKIINILGVKIKFKTKALEIKNLKHQLSKANKQIDKCNQNYKLLDNKFEAIYQMQTISNIDVRENSVLLCETNPCHGELLPGVAKYFFDLGYNVDVLLSKSENSLNLFSCMTDYSLRIYESSSLCAKMLFQNKQFIEQYKFLYINSDRIYDASVGKEFLSYEYYENVPLPKNRLLNMCHHPEDINEEIYHTRTLLTLADFPIEYKERPIVVNAHYFGDIDFSKKNDITTFICVGNIESKRKNHSLLCDAVRSLIDKGITNFKINVIARMGNLKNIDSDILPYLDFKGRLSYEDMYNEMKNADFFLTLLDPENPEHDRYLTIGTSGSFQLIYGFIKPCLIANKFADKYGFTNNNSIVYERNEDLVGAMEQAINMSQEEYKLKQDSLKDLSDEIEADSISNLKSILDKEVLYV